LLSNNFNDPSAKSNNISRMIKNSVSIEELKVEAHKCRPLCAFCHRIYTNYFYGNQYI